MDKQRRDYAAAVCHFRPLRWFSCSTHALRSNALDFYWDCERTAGLVKTPAGIVAGSRCFARENGETRIAARARTRISEIVAAVYYRRLSRIKESRRS